MKILVIDIGGTNVKVFAHGLNAPVKIESGRHMTPRKMVNAVRKIVAETHFSGVSIGYPGAVKNGKPFRDPTISRVNGSDSTSKRRLGRE
jgi:predicted NBD/HSP70 family sugar kinase